MSQLVIREDYKRIAVLSINNPPVNALGPGVPEAILDALVVADDDPEIDAIVLVGAGRTFIAGADIRELQQIAGGEKRFDEFLQHFLDRVESTAKPLVCAIHGTAFGGGLETAMACHWRVAHKDAMVGQPEVKLGLIPGAAGTQRLPRLIGIADAAQMCALGEPISATAAARKGVVDEVIEDELIPAAVRFAEKLVEDEVEIKRTSERDDLVHNAIYHNAIQRLRDQLDDEKPGELAPGLAIDAVVATASMRFADGCRHELELFHECMDGPQARALIRMFFGQREVQRRVKSSGKSGPYSGGRALLVGKLPSMQTWKNRCESFDLDVEFIDAQVSETVVANACDSFGPDVIIVGSSLGGWAEANQVATACQKEICPDALCLIANPFDDSSFSEFEIGEVTAPIVALDPWPSTQVLEVVADEELLATIDSQLAQFAKQLSLSVVRVDQLTSAIARQIWRAGELEAQACVEKGASTEQIIEAWHEFGFLRKPVLISFSDEQQHEESAGVLIVQRCVDAMINEAVNIAGNQTVASDLAVDVIAVLGMGFPAFQGGPLWYLSESGMSETLDRITRYAEEADTSWKISPYWQERVDER